jgi:hypothetical protein
MWFGAPVVYASDCPMADLIGDGGASAEPGVDAFCSAARRVWDESAAFGPRAAQRARVHTWRGSAERVMDVLASLRR